jgi:hypothetical protein
MQKLPSFVAKNLVGYAGRKVSNVTIPVVEEMVIVDASVSTGEAGGGYVMVSGNVDARTLELRTATSLSWLWHNQARRGEAHALLSENRSRPPGHGSWTATGRRCDSRTIGHITRGRECRWIAQLVWP